MLQRMNESAKKQVLAEFFSAGKVREYKKGEIIIRPDDPPTGVFYIEKGYVRLYSLTIDGEEKLYTVFKPDDIFPLHWALHKIHKNVHYEAMTPCTLRKVTREEFTAFLTKSTDALFELSDRLIDLYAEFADRVDNLEIAHSYPRVVARLICLGKKLGLKDGNNILIKAPITHKDIAASIAMTRETASRELEVLVKKRLVGYRNHFIVIYNIDKLKQELEAYYSE